MLVAAYIALVALIMANGDTLFGKKDGPLTMVAVLLLFVLSTAVMGSLIFGRPVLWYLDGRKQEALKLLGATISCLAVITVVVLATLAFIK